MSYKTSRQAALTVNGTQLARKPSLSVPDRDSIQSSQNNYDSYTASQNAIIKSEVMEIDEQLEKELGALII
ncbi:3388_t:CDS:2 [Entrophospora sp. SA101]|nr:3388_t:CDS:2 [Entrophospora sp. SA101]CAJ0837007.1 9872_t:CDS:2 [Entrophospora sp. SA101]CAJ0881001.1 22519_t:CDS:2 [Entrophospora sp. SA101]